MVTLSTFGHSEDVLPRTRKKVTLPCSAKLTRKKVTFGSMGMSYAGITVTFDRDVTRKKVTVKQGN